MAYRDLRDFLAQLEALGELRRVAAPVSPRLAAFARMAASDAVQKLLARHQTEILLGGDGARAVSLALAAVRAGRSGLAVVPAADLVALLRKRFEGSVTALEAAIARLDVTPPVPDAFSVHGYARVL